MAIILGIIGVILAIGLISALIGAVITIVKYLFIALYHVVKWLLIIAVPIGVIGFFVYLFTLIGFWAIAAFAAFVLLIWVIKRLGPESLETRMKRVFHEYEMASIEDLLNNIEGNASEEQIWKVLEKFCKQGNVELIDFGKDDSMLYRWTEKRNYPQGVITTHLQVD